MCVAVIGEIAGDGWEDYQKSAQRAGFDLWFLNGQAIDVAARIKSLDAMVIVPDQLSPRELQEAVAMAAERKIPVLCATCEGAVFCGRTHGRCSHNCSSHRHSPETDLFCPADENDNQN